MKIQGRVEIEGITLQVDIEAPDDTQELYVTNVHPNCIVIPKERWRIEHLGLAPETLNEVQNKGIRTLGDLVDSRWQVSQNGLSETTRQNIQETLSRFREMAIIFEKPQDKKQSATPRLSEEVSERVEAKTPPTTPQSPPAAIKAPLSTPLSQTGLWERSVTILGQRHKVRTLHDLLKLGRAKVVMTPGIAHLEVKDIEARLARLGYSWSDWNEEQETGMAGPGGLPPESAEHLSEQHLSQEGLRKAL